MAPLPQGADTVSFCMLCSTVYNMAIAHPLFSLEQRSRLHARLQEHFEAAATASASPIKGTPGKTKAGAGSGPLPGDNDTVVDAQIVDVQPQLRGRDYDFVMEVTWSNGYVGTCRRTYQNFFDFHCALLDKYPEEQNKSSRTLPMLPGWCWTRRKT